MNTKLNNAVAALPEVYQPIFGHPELSSAISRTCSDRLSHIIHIYQSFETHLKRPLRVLDLGCAQGFFSIHLAELGAIVHGIDFLDANIIVCNMLADEHPEFNTCFECTAIETVVNAIVPDQYDLVLWLSVFHHITHLQGLTFAQQLISTIANNIKIGIFELALANEPLYWAASQPQNQKELLQGYAFIHEIARHPTHLSDITRPLYVTSNHYWFLNNQIGEFDSFTFSSHILEQSHHQKTRRYYFNDSHLLKMFDLSDPIRGQYNLIEYRQEVDFLTKSLQSYSMPKLVLYGHNTETSWLLREKSPGRLLVDIIRTNTTYDAHSILKNVLLQLVALEKAGLYHTDLRTWNVLIDIDGYATLIDYGAISNNKNTPNPSNDIFLNFLIFAYEVIAGGIKFLSSAYEPVISPYQLLSPYHNWVLNLLSQPIAEWSFQFIFDLFIKIDVLNKIIPSSVIEDKFYLRMCYSKKNTDDLVYRINTVQQELISAQQELEDTRQKLTDCSQQLQHTSQELIMVYGSKSWRITKPMRNTRLAINLLIIKVNHIFHLKKMVRNLIINALYFILKNKKLAMTGMRFINKFPRFKQYLLFLLATKKLARDVNFTEKAISPRKEKNLSTTNLSDACVGNKIYRKGINIQIAIMAMATKKNIHPPLQQNKSSLKKLK